jgi:cobalt-zinc-cadmium efflux system protein
LDDHHIHLEAHLDFVEDLPLSKSTKIVEYIIKNLHDNFGIEHCTFQAEYDKNDKKDFVYK